MIGFGLVARGLLIDSVLNVAFLKIIYFCSENEVVIMEKTIELVNVWAAFSRQYPQAGIDDFCRHYLAHEKEKASKTKLPSGGFLPTAVY
jgi:hypothetical protein